MTATATNAGSVAERDWTIYVGGRPLPVAGRCDVEDPATGRVLTAVPDLSPGEVDLVIRAAAEAQQAWAMLPHSRSSEIKSTSARTTSPCCCVMLRSLRESAAMKVL